MIDGIFLLCHIQCSGGEAFLVRLGFTLVRYRLECFTPTLLFLWVINEKDFFFIARIFFCEYYFL